METCFRGGKTTLAGGVIVNEERFKSLEAKKSAFSER